jgi:hypothetical protein
MKKQFLLIAAFAAIVIAGTPALAAASDVMPPAQQNALVQKYCAVCHSDAHPNGMLSFEHFDAAHPDPGLMAMMAAKLGTGALGASGTPLPDKPTQDAFLSALTAESAGSTAWVVNQAPVLTASIVRQLPSTDKQAHGEPDLYRLTVSCHADKHKGAIHLEWSPGVPKQGQMMSASVDGTAPLTYKIEGTETMGNGQKGTSGPGAVVLGTPLPGRTLTIDNLFPEETVVFPFTELPAATRRQLSACF